MTMSTRTLSSRLMRSTHGPSTGVRPSTVMPRVVKKLTAAVRSSTTTLTWSNLLIVMPPGHSRAMRCRPGRPFSRVGRGLAGRQRHAVWLREEIDQAFMFEEIVGASAVLKTVLSHVVNVAPTDSTVLISGETGTGKELIPRAIHKHSRRTKRAFVSMNCAATPPSLIASELFGHEKGAFTGGLENLLDGVNRPVPVTLSRTHSEQAIEERVLRRRRLEPGQRPEVVVRVVAHAGECHVDQRAVVGLEREPEIELQRAVGVRGHPIGAAEDAAAQAFAFKRPAG